MSTVPLPRDVSASVLTTGLATASRIVAIVGILLVIPIIVDVLLAADAAASIPFAIAPNLAIALLALVLLLRPSIVTAALYVVGGGIASVTSVLVLASADPTIAEPGPYVLNRVATSLLLVGSLGGSARSGIIWSVAAYVSAQSSLLLGWSVAGLEGSVGYGPTIVVVILVSAYGVLAFARARARRRVPQLDQLQRAMLLAERERELQRRAAAVVHDTVLADLAVVATTVGPVSERMRAHILKDLDVIERTSVVESPAPEGERTSFAVALLDLAQDYQWSGVTVSVSGAEELSLDVPEAIADALVGAARAALDNVVAHARTDRAELVVGGRDEAIALLVVDAGVGFDPDEVGIDRLGISTAIDARIRDVGGTVRIWSGDEGTTVMIRVPVGEPS